MDGVNDFFLFIDPSIFPYFLHTFYQNVYSHLHYNLISALLHTDRELLYS